MFCFCPSGKCQTDDKILEVTYFLLHDPTVFPLHTLSESSAVLSVYVSASTGLHRPYLECQN